MTKHILTNDIGKAQQLQASADKQKALAQKCVDAFNATFNSMSLPSLEDSEFPYYLASGTHWAVVRWQDAQKVPEGWPANADRERFLDLLQRPSLDHFDKLCSAVTRGDLLILKDGLVDFDEAALERELDQASIILDDQESELLSRLNNILDELHSADLLKFDPFTERVAPVDLSSLGLRRDVWSTGRESFVWDAEKIKATLQRMIRERR